LGSGSGNCQKLQNTLTCFSKKGVGILKNFKKHSRKRERRECIFQKSSISTPSSPNIESVKVKKARNTLPRVKTKRVEKFKNQEIHSLKLKPREWKRHKIIKYAPSSQNPGSAKAKKARNTLRPSKPREWKSPKSKKYTLTSPNPGSEMQAFHTKSGARPEAGRRVYVKGRLRSSRRRCG